jgi:hypothetical protein
MLHSAWIALTALLICLFLVSMLLLAYTCGCESGTPFSSLQPSPPVIEFVISRYGERLDWLADRTIIPRRPNTVLTVYNKGPPIQAGDVPKLPHYMNIRIVPRANVGRDFETYLYHIVHGLETETLADITVFLPDTCATIASKRVQAQYICSQLPRVTCITEPHRRDEEYTDVNLRAMFSSFQLSSYECRGPANKTLNPDSALAPADPRPMGEWMRAVLGEDMETTGPLAYWGILAATRSMIAQRPLDLYRRLLHTVSHHHSPEAAHYLERIWGTLLRCPRA